MDRRAFLIASSCAAASIVAGCTVNQPTTQPSGSLSTPVPSTQPAPTPNLLTVLETAYTDALPWIDLAVSADPTLQPYVVAVQAATALATSAPTLAAINALADDIATLFAHKTVVAAKAAVRSVTVPMAASVKFVKPA